MFLKPIKNFIKKIFHLVDEADFLELGKMYEQNARELNFYKNIKISCKLRFDEELPAKVNNDRRYAVKDYLKVCDIVQDGRIYYLDETAAIYFADRSIVVAPIQLDLSILKTKEEINSAPQDK